MFCSTKKRNFANMIELDRHIEILLLSNDCVIVPGFGGFMTHHVEARHDDTDNMFLPPLRTLGFNPQLTLNDSLLAQSYIETYDISYPEALRRIQSEVEELRQILDNEGSYELSDIGTLFVNEYGRYEFQPCEAGILTPELYGLYAFEMKPLAEQHKAEVVSIQNEKPVEDEKPKEKAIIIPLSTVRKAVAACVAVLALMLFPSPTSDNNTNTLAGTASQTSVLRDVMPKNVVNGQPNSIVSNDEINIVSAQKAIIKQVEALQSANETTQQGGFTIVMMSHISKKNAEQYLEMLGEKGFNEGRILEEEGQALKIVYGQYATNDDAVAALLALKKNKDFAYGWILELNKQ